MPSTSTTAPQTTFNDPARKYDLILNIHWVPEDHNPDQPHQDISSLQDAPLLLANPDTDEHIHKATVTLSNVRRATIESIRMIDPARTIHEVEVIDTAGLAFTEEEAQGTSRDVWNTVLVAAVMRTRQKAEEERNSDIAAEWDFDIAEGDDDHFGAYGDHQAMVTGQSPNKDEYEVI